MIEPREQTNFFVDVVWLALLLPYDSLDDAPAHPMGRQLFILWLLRDQDLGAEADLIPHQLIVVRMQHLVELRL